LIETVRLVLRRWQAGDREPFAAMGQDAEVMRHFPALLTRTESDALIDRFDTRIDADGYGMWALERRGDGAFIGFTGLLPVGFPSPIENDVEIGWRLARTAWGQGYATEAAAASLAFAWRRTTALRIVSMAVTANTASIAVMHRIGLARRPDLDFDHPRLAPDSPLRRHIVHAIDRPIEQP
jgi:RimJ/RimL family protein N-acetyltransferase